MGFLLCYPEGVSSTHKFRLGPYVVDAVSGEVLGAGEVRRMTPKATQVLLTLGAPGAGVVSKEQLFRSVWPRRVVSDATLASCIQELRDALGDDARQPRFIQTAHRRGYRLLVPLEPLQDECTPPARTTPLLVGRETELALLRAEFERALAGQRRIVFVSGEPGIGKTTLLDAFLATGTAGFVHATGRCLEHFGPREPYLPWLDAIGAVSGGQQGDRILRLLRRHAPGWLAQLPALVDEAEHAALMRRTVGITGARMMRELADAIEAAAREMPLILRLEDLHWSDAASLECLAFIARGDQPARLLVLATLRQPESLARDHPLATVYAELAPREQCRDLRLGALDPPAVSAYLAHRIGARPDDVRELANAVHAHTEGNPLFVVHVVDNLLTGGAIEPGNPGQISVSAELIARTIPAQLRSLIDLHLERLDAQELEALTAASAMGAEFSADVVGRVRGLTTEAAEAICTGLARRGAFITQVQQSAEDKSTSYRFSHSLYRAVLYERLPVATRAALHARIGDSLETLLGDAAPERATDLAAHFERGGQAEKAARYHLLAGQRAARRSDARTAVEHFRRALALVPRLSDADERNRLELDLRIALGGQLLASSGWGASEAESMYARAQQMCSSGSASQESFTALWGLWMYRWGRAQLRDASELGSQLRHVAARSTDRGLQLQAHHASWATALSRGELGACSEHAAAGTALYDPAEHSAHAARFGNHDPGSCALHFGAMAHALRGEAERARHDCTRAVALTETIEHPFSNVIALYFAAAIHQMLRDVSCVEQFAARAVKVASDHGFALLQAWSTVLLGWSAVERGAAAAGCQQMREAIDRARSTGTEQFQTYLHAVLAEACMKAGRIDEARSAAARGLEIADATQERFFEAELLHLAGALASDADTRSAYLKRALAVAERQGALLLQSRIEASLRNTCPRSQDIPT